MNADEIKSLIKKIAETDSRKEHQKLLNTLTECCSLFIKNVDEVAKKVGTEPPWQPLLLAFNPDKVAFQFKSDPTVWKADTTCYGTHDVEFFTITAFENNLENNLENDIPLELPWFNMSIEDWRKKLITDKREIIEKEIVAAQIKVKMAQDRLSRFNAKFKL